MGEGPNVMQIVSSADKIEIPIDKTATVYTHSFHLGGGEYFAIAYKATSDGSVKLKIELQQSYKLPDTEGLDDATYVVPTSYSDIEAALATETWHIVKLTPNCLPYLRFKITGGGAPSANDASTTLQIKLGIQYY